MQRERRIEDRGGRSFVQHGLEAAKRRADFPHVVVGRLEPVLTQDRVENERPAGVGDIRRDGGSAQIRKRVDGGLNKEMIEAVVAACHDYRIGVAGLDHGNGLIGGAMNDLVTALGQAIALFRRVGRGAQVDREAALFEQSVGLRREQRQRLGAGKHHDGELDHSVA